jgi:hypothetical protein
MLRGIERLPLSATSPSSRPAIHSLPRTLPSSVSPNPFVCLPALVAHPCESRRLYPSNSHFGTQRTSRTARRVHPHENREHSPHSSPLISNSSALFCALWHLRKSQLISFLSFPHSFALSPGGALAPRDLPLPRLSRLVALATKLTSACIEYPMAATQAIRPPANFFKESQIIGRRI